MRRHAMREDDPNRWYYTPAQVAPIVNVEPGNWTKTIRADKTAVPWSVIQCGSYVKFPKTEVDTLLIKWKLPTPDQLREQREAEAQEAT